MWCWLRAARNRRDAASQKKQRKKERKKEREKKVIVVAADDRNGVAALLVSHFCCPCFQNHSALAPHSFFSFFFGQLARIKGPCERIKRRGGRRGEPREKGVAIARSFVATAATGCNYFVTVILLRDGSPRGRNSLPRHCRTRLGRETAKFCFRLT